MLVQPTVPPAPPGPVATGATCAPSLDAPARLVAPAATGQSPTRFLLGGLSNGQVAVAIHAAGLPANAAALTVAEIEGMAITGLCQLGLAEARRINDESRKVNTAYCAKTRHNRLVDVRTEIATINRLWGSRKQEQQAVDLAYRLLCSLARTNAAR
ncbi:hypothetical protein QQG74_00505 [Micromonospora sp. FIMYZ51]|uniref:hypothetical protein n=1 Tax=Micromonospora sp. FIMYZ51 TaxID=3051832 RepID=UPI00311EEB0F